MKPNQNWLQVPGEPGVNPSARPCEPNVANYKGWAQQPASIVEFPTGKDGTVEGAGLKFWKEDRAAGTLAPSPPDPSGDILNPGIQRAEVQDEVSCT